ncbi:hypothetical protein JCM10213_002850 [Rhodosporidiobolus nylandii]
MATLHINTQTHPHQRQQWSPLGTAPSPTSSDLSSRCRQLAHRLGHDAVEADPVFVHPGERPVPDSPRRHSPSASPGRFSPLISPRSGHAQLHPPPTPEGSFILDTLVEEDGGTDTPKAENVATASPFSAGSGGAAPHSHGPGEGAYGTSGAADDEISFTSPVASFGLGGRRRSSFSAGVWDAPDEANQDEAMAAAVVEEQVVALRTALKEGTTWMPVDLWLVDGELLVAKNQQSLDPSQTFSSLFVEPLLRVFQTMAVPVGTVHRRRSSVFAHINPQHPFQLVVRCHTAPSVTFSYLLNALQPLQDASLLSAYCPNADVHTPALITVVSSDADGAELVPLEDLTASTEPRIVFRDADIGAFESEDGASQFSREITPVAAGNLEKATGWNGQSPITDQQRQRIIKQIELAHRKQIKVRYEGLPGFPVHVRESVRGVLTGLGVDYL